MYYKAAKNLKIYRKNKSIEKANVLAKCNAFKGKK